MNHVTRRRGDAEIRGRGSRGICAGNLDESVGRRLEKQEETLRVSAPPRESLNVIADASYLSVPISVYPWLNLLRKLGSCHAEARRRGDGGAEAAGFALGSLDKSVGRRLEKQEEILRVSAPPRESLCEETSDHRPLPRPLDHF